MSSLNGCSLKVKVAKGYFQGDVCLYSGPWWLMTFCRGCEFWWGEGRYALPHSSMMQYLEVILDEKIRLD